AQPELAVTLVEPRQKRISFLRHIIRTLGLTNVRIADRRIEPGQRRDGPEFSFITSRAVASTRPGKPAPVPTSSRLASDSVSGPYCWIIGSRVRESRKCFSTISLAPVLRAIRLIRLLHFCSSRQ
ncbi:MAG: hypothetical protein D3904_16020, partial [Candidatus Electrothrix sp. EH2]|nr:hypothetical protein [Candidatus Electrothrix sp. EH2]